MESEKGKPLPERRRAAEAKVRASEARLEYAAYWLQMTRQLSTEGVTSREDVHQAEFEHYSAEIALAHARKELTQTLQGARPALYCGRRRRLRHSQPGAGGAPWRKMSE